MDKKSGCKIKGNCRSGKKYEVINSSIKEKQNMLKQLDDVAKRIQECRMWLSMPTRRLKN